MVISRRLWPRPLQQLDLRPVRATFSSTLARHKNRLAAHIEVLASRRASPGRGAARKDFVAGFRDSAHGKRLTCALDGWRLMLSLPGRAASPPCWVAADGTESALALKL